MVLKPEQNNNSYISFDITVKSNTQYTLSVENIIVENLGTWVGTCYVYEYNSGGTQHYITNMNNTNKIRTFTTQADTVRLRVQPYSLSGTVDTWENGQITWKKIMLCEGTDTNYSPYTANPIELCKIGNYQDKLYYDSGKWYIEKQIGKVVLNGTEDWYYYTATSKPVFYLICEQYNISYKIQSGLLCYSNYYEGKGQVASFDNVYNLGNNVIAFRTAFTRIVIRNDSITSVADFKTWLSNNNTTVYYVLATPTYTEITDTYLLEQLNGLLDIDLYENLCY